MRWISCPRKQILKAVRSNHGSLELMHGQVSSNSLAGVKYMLHKYCKPLKHSLTIAGCEVITAMALGCDAV
jgi:hypothetical protein